jgi:hypothetical protein
MRDPENTMPTAFPPAIERALAFLAHPDAQAFQPAPAAQAGPVRALQVERRNQPLRVRADGLDVQELHGRAAVDSILSDFTNLELQPIPQDAMREQLRRAGLTLADRGARS